MNIALNRKKRVEPVTNRVYKLRMNGPSKDYLLIEKTIAFLDAHHTLQPSLEEIARAVGLSPFHFQRLFKNWAGVSPKRFVQFLTLRHSKSLLDQSRSVLEASLAAGLSGPSRLHDLFVHCEAVTPGQYKSKGKGVDLRYGIHPSPFGDVLIALTEHGICHLEFIASQEGIDPADYLKKIWPKCTGVSEDHNMTSRVANTIFEKTQRPIHIHLRGTNFQLKVWQALLNIPEGHVVAYQDVAKLIGHPQSSRAVGTAIGNNAVAYLIPCHRVINSLGKTGNYRWGPLRKKALLGWESSKNG